MAASIEGMSVKAVDGKTVWTSATTGVVLTNSGGKQPYTLFVPGRDGAPADEMKFDYLDQAVEAWSKAWLEWAAVEIGLGFHPDTSAENYVPPLPAALAAEYDSMISLSHQTLQDPYAVSIEAWERAGLIEAAKP